MLVAILYTVVLAMDPHLVEDPIFALPTKPHPTQIPIQTLDTPTVHHLATVMAAPSPSHSWQEVTNFNLIKLKCFMKLLETNKLKYVSVWVACGLRPQNEIKLGQTSLGSSTSLSN